MELCEKRFVMNESPTAACHASTIYRKKNGEILTAWFGGSKEGADDVGIYFSRKSEGCGFQAARKIAGGMEPHWNPVLFSEDDRKILLFYKKGRLISKWRTYIRISTDGGETFGEERELVPGDTGGRGPVRNKPVQLSNGRILCPASVEGDVWKAFTDISEDGGKTFVRSNWIEICKRTTLNMHFGNKINKSDCECNIKVYDKDSEKYESKSHSESDIPVSDQSFHGRGVIQPTLWFDNENDIHMLLRSTEGKIYRSDSDDGGYRWSSAVPTDIPNNNSGIDITKLSDGRLILVHNPVGKNWGARSPLSISVSEDNGKTFERLCDLENDPGEFSYPAIVSQQNEIYVTYTYDRKNIAFCHIKL